MTYFNLKIVLQNSYVDKIEAVARKLKSWTMLYLYVCIISILFTCVRTALTTTTATRRSKSNRFDKRSIKFRTCSTLFGTFLCRLFMNTKSNARYENRVAHTTPFLSRRERDATRNFWVLLNCSSWINWDREVLKWHAAKPSCWREIWVVERKIFVLRLNYQTYK